MKNNYLNAFKEKLAKEKVFAAAFILAAASSLAVRPKISYINFKVLVLLFNLMIVVAAFEKLRVMDKIAVEILTRCKNTRMVSLVFIVVTFFSSMVVTNDVALLTFVPLAILTLKNARIDSMKTVVIQTLAANIGSSLTPMGNPQNLFLFTHYKLSGVEFFSVTIPFVFTGFLWLLFLNRRTLRRSIKISVQKVHIEDKKRTYVYIVLFLIITASVFSLIDYRCTFAAVLACVMILDRHLIKEVDYFLLATFVGFFVFIGNISNIELVQAQLRLFLKIPHMPYISSIVLSQVISNVPCSILVSSFTTNWREVLLGVNVGGMGTIIASLASLISYKIYINENIDKSSEYMKKFYMYNFASLFLFGVIIYIQTLYF